MTPAEIAGKLTPAQIRALRDPQGCDTETLFDLVDWEGCNDIDLVNYTLDGLTDLGRAVLAALNAKDAI